jgi:TPR repeat protein
VRKDYRKAVYWYRKAADQGDPFGQCNLGVCYDKGQGVHQDHTLAAAWYLKAAKQGDAQAQSNLAESYTNGDGVRKSYADAYFWLSLAASNIKGKERKLAARGLETAAAHLTSVRLSKADTRVKQWLLQSPPRQTRRVKRSSGNR